MDAPALKARLAALIGRLSDGLVEREAAVRLALLAALAGEHLLLVGAPGTAKSELARRLHRAFRDAAYFERLLTRFTVPEELFGPLSIAALEQDRYERLTDGYLPKASVAFIDEVFKANSAILNALLTLLNEREFDNGAARERSPLISVIGATNEVPEDEIAAAFYDRFLIRCEVGPVSGSGFADLLALPSEDAPDVPESLTLSRAELARIARRARSVALPAEVTHLLAALREFLAAEGIYVSDRRWRKIVGLLRTAAATDGRDEVSVWDLWLLQFCAAERVGQRARIAEWTGSRLGSWQALNPERFTRAVEAMEAQVELERNADELNYDASGRLATISGMDDAKHGEAAPRMTYFSRRRSYGPSHIRARAAQTEALMAEIEGYLRRLDGALADLDGIVAGHLWITADFLPAARGHLLGTRNNVLALRERLAVARDGFLALPRREAEASEPDPVPEPVALG